MNIDIFEHDATCTWAVLGLQELNLKGRMMGRWEYESQSAHNPLSNECNGQLTPPI